VARSATSNAAPPPWLPFSLVDVRPLQDVKENATAKNPQVASFLRSTLDSIDRITLQRMSMKTFAAVIVTFAAQPDYWQKY